jgi:hypothetical protein
MPQSAMYRRLGRRSQSEYNSTAVFAYRPDAPVGIDPGSSRVLPLTESSRHLRNGSLVFIREKCNRGPPSTMPARRSECRKEMRVAAHQVPLSTTAWCSDILAGPPSTIARFGQSLFLLHSRPETPSITAWDAKPFMRTTPAHRPSALPVSTLRTASAPGRPTSSRRSKQRNTTLNRSLLVIQEKNNRDPSSRMPTRRS